MQSIEGGERFTIIRKVGDGYTYDMMMINRETSMVLDFM